MYWFVSGKRDIADFYVAIRDQKSGDIVWEQSVLYNKRGVQLPLVDIPGDVNNLQICVIAKQSSMELSRWFHSQCRPLADKFNVNKPQKPALSTSSAAGTAIARLSGTIITPIMGYTLCKYLYIL